MKKIFGLLLATAPLFSLAQDLQTVTQNGNTTTLGINVGGNVGIGTTIPTQKLTLNGNLGFSGDNVNRYIITDATYTGTGKVTMQAGAGSAGFGGGINLYGHANALKPGWVVAGISASAGATGTATEGRFTVNDQGLGDGVDLFTVLRSGNVGIGTANPLGNLHVENTSISTLRLSTNNEPGGYYSEVINRYDALNSLLITNGSKNILRSTVEGKVQIELGNASNQNINLLTEKVTIPNGNVGIGTTTPNEKLAVNGKIRAKEIKVESANWPDYVFAEGYKVGTLEELESYIKVNKRLPEMPSAKEVETNGVELGEMNKLLLKKVEELTLLLIEQNKKNEKQEQAIDELRKELEKVKSKK